jgi:hypothetical protein
MKFNTKIFDAKSCYNSADMTSDRLLIDNSLEVASRATMSLNDDVPLNVPLFDMLPVELLASHLMPFFGPRRFRFVTAVCRKFYDAYTTCYPTKVTEIDASTVEHAQICFSERHDRLHPGKVTGIDASTSIHCVVHVSDGLFFTDMEAFSCEDVPKTRLCWLASRNTDSSVLRYLHSIGCEWDENVCWSIAEKGDLQTLQWARAQGCPWDKRTCSRAALNGHLHIIQWARDHDAPWCYLTPQNAAMTGHYDIVKWATSNGCPLNFPVYIRAARNARFQRQSEMTSRSMTS